MPIQRTRRGARRRRAGRRRLEASRLDRWLNTAVTVAVITALAVGSAAVLAHWLL
ncbi:hypothetical protein [Halomonas cibimaris]|uniref:hypothetical protein n=1 Tax=Halomonas cibimaris TaxID=657012 RepID=UPI0031CE602B